MSLKTHGDSPQEENAFSFVKLGNMIPPPPTVKAATGNTARSPSFQPSFTSVSPPFKWVEVPAARALLLSLVGGGQVNREGATAQRTRD